MHTPAHTPTSSKDLDRIGIIPGSMTTAVWKEQYAQTVQCRTTSMSDIKTNHTPDDSLRCMPEVLADEQEDEELRIIAEQAGLWRLQGDKLCQVWHIDDILFVCKVFKQQWDIGEW